MAYAFSLLSFIRVFHSDPLVRVRAGGRDGRGRRDWDWDWDWDWSDSAFELVDLGDGVVVGTRRGGGPHGNGSGRC